MKASDFGCSHSMTHSCYLCLAGTDTSAKKMETATINAQNVFIALLNAHAQCKIEL